MHTHPWSDLLPLLAKVHQTHQDWPEDAGAASAEEVEDYRRFFSQLLFNGAMLEYSGADSRSSRLALPAAAFE